MRIAFHKIALASVAALVGPVLRSSARAVILVAAVIVLFGSHSPFVNAQSASTELTPVSKSTDRNLRDEDLWSCFNGAGFVGVNECGDEITQQLLATRPSTFRGLDLRVGDILRCEQLAGQAGATGLGGVKCSALRVDGTVDTAQETGTAGILTSQTDANGRTTGTQEAGVVDRVGNAVVGGVRDGISGLAGSLIAAIGESILTIATLFLGLAGVFFNLVVVKAVFQFSTLIGNSPGLLLAWGILRDVANMALLFGFIFLGLKTVLQVDSVPAQKAIPRLLIFAVLMNFSLFATQAVIDVSNVLASAMYTQANSDPCAIQGQAVQQQSGGFAAAQQDLEDCAVNIGIAGSLMNASGLSTLFKINDNSASLSLSMATYIGLALFATIGAVVFIAGGIMLVVRAIKLTFLMVASPLLFAALAIPQFQKQGQKYWNDLISNAFFAPIFLLLILISLKITEGIGGVTNGGMAAALTAPNASVMGVFLVFALVIGFMLASLIAAKRFGVSGADFAISTGTKLAFGTLGRTTTFAGNLVGKGARVGAQRTAGAIQGSSVGRAYAQTRFSQSNFGKKFNKGVAGAGKAAVAQTAGRLENANLDVRRIGRVQAGLKDIGAGDGAKPIDRDKSVIKSVTDDTKKRVGAYDDQVKKRAQEAMLGDIVRKAKSGEVLTSEEKRFLAKKSSKELEEIDEVKKGEAALIELLTPEQFDNLMKSSNLSDGDKNKIREGRYKSLTSAAESGNTANIKSITRNMSKSDIEQVPPELLQNAAFLESLSDKQRDDLAGSNKRTADERKAVRDASPVSIFEAGFGDPDIETRALSPDAQLARLDAIKKFTTLTVPQIGKLNLKILSHPQIVPKLKVSTLIELQESKRLTVEQVSQLRDAITSMGSPEVKQYIAPGGAGNTYWA